MSTYRLFREIGEMKSFFYSIFDQRKVIWSLVVNDIRTRYMGSIFGSLWVFVLPMLNISIMWFAFEHGLKQGGVNGTPFIVWLVAGMVPWIFFSDAVANSTGSIIEKSFLVKKIVFNVELLPLVKILASLILFIFLSIIMILLALGYGFYPDKYWFQLPYYMVCIISLVFALSWLTSSVVVFYRDFGQLIAVVLQVGFWATPVFWSVDLLSENLRFFVMLNPVAYVVGGYRESLISKIWFWERPVQMACFWVVVVTFCIVGMKLFRRLRPHFADVL